MLLEASWRLERRDGNRDESYWDLQGGGGQSLGSDTWMTLHKARAELWFGAFLVTRDSDKNERNDVLFPTGGLAKHNYKTAFVNMRSVLMEGGSGGCQLLFVQCRKPRSCFLQAPQPGPRALARQADRGRERMSRHWGSNCCCTRSCQDLSVRAPGEQC